MRQPLFFILLSHPLSGAIFVLYQAMDMHIRPATTDDAYAVSHLSAQLGYYLSIDDSRSNLERLKESEDDIVFVAESDGEVIAWIHVFYAVRVETKPFCEIAGLVTDKAYRGKGVGSQLIYKACEWCRLKSVDSLRVRTNVVRTETHKFYERAGFKLDKQQRVYGMSIE